MAVFLLVSVLAPSLALSHYLHNDCEEASHHSIVQGEHQSQHDHANKETNSKEANSNESEDCCSCPLHHTGCVHFGGLLQSESPASKGRFIAASLYLSFSRAVTPDPDLEAPFQPPRA